MGAEQTPDLSGGQGVAPCIARFFYHFFVFSLAFCRFVFKGRDAVYFVKGAVEGAGGFEADGFAYLGNRHIRAQQKIARLRHSKKVHVFEKPRFHFVVENVRYVIFAEEEFLLEKLERYILSIIFRAVFDYPFTTVSFGAEFAL